MRSILCATKSILATLALLIATPLLAQNKVVPAAPIPTQIATAKTAFLSIGDAGKYIDIAREYNVFYSALSMWDHYQLALRPADADLVLQVQTVILESSAYLSVRILDRATGVQLWIISEPYPTDAGFTEAEKEKSLALTAKALMADLTILSQPNATAAPTQKIAPKNE